MTDQTNKLEPCPFCGGEVAHTQGFYPLILGHLIDCKSCGASSPIKQSKEEAFAVWNRRASTPAADQEAYEQECLNMAAEGIKYWKDKYEALVAASAPAAGSVPSDEANESTRNGGHDE